MDSSLSVLAVVVILSVCLVAVFVVGQPEANPIQIQVCLYSSFALFGRPRHAVAFTLYCIGVASS